MRFWRHLTPEPVPGPDPGADAVAEDTENRKSEEETAAAELQPAPSPEPEATEKNSTAEAPSGDADQEERGLWSGGFWRRGVPAAQPQQAASSEPFEPATVEIPPGNTEAQERRGWFARLKAGMARSSRSAGGGAGVCGGAPCRRVARNNPNP